MSPGDEPGVTVDAPARPRVRSAPPPRPPRAPEPGPLSPGRAVAGAAVAVAGVCLFLGALLLVSGDPSPGPGSAGPVLQTPPDALLPGSPPAETEAAPVDPPPAPATGPARPSAPPAPLPPALPPAPPPATPPATPPARPDVVAVTVLNNSNRTGLADRAARRFVRGGWPVQLTGNFRGQIPVTTVYYDPGLEASARAFARDFDGIARVRPRFATLPARGVVVVLTREFQV